MSTSSCPRARRGPGQLSLEPLPQRARRGLAGVHELVQSRQPPGWHGSGHARRGLHLDAAHPGRPRGRRGLRPRHPGDPLRVDQQGGSQPVRGLPGWAFPGPLRGLDGIDRTRPRRRPRAGERRPDLDGIPTGGPGPEVAPRSNQPHLGCIAPGASKGMWPALPYTTPNGIGLVNTAESSDPRPRNLFRVSRAVSASRWGEGVTADGENAPSRNGTYSASNLSGAVARRPGAARRHANSG